LGLADVLLVFVCGGVADVCDVCAAADNPKAAERTTADIDADLDITKLNLSFLTCISLHPKLTIIWLTRH
jgi:hypothetical protein